MMLHASGWDFKRLAKIMQVIPAWRVDDKTILLITSGSFNENVLHYFFLIREYLQIGTILDFLEFFWLLLKRLG